MVWGLSMWIQGAGRTHTWDSTSWKNKLCWSCVTTYLWRGTALRLFSAGSVVIGVMHGPGVNRAVCTHQFPCRHQERAQSSRAVLFLVAISLGKSWVRRPSGSCPSHCIIWGIRRLVGVGDMQGRESGRLDRDRDVWSRLQERGSAVKC